MFHAKPTNFVSSATEILSHSLVLLSFMVPSTDGVLVTLLDNGPYFLPYSLMELKSESGFLNNY